MASVDICVTRKCETIAPVAGRRLQLEGWHPGRVLVVLRRILDLLAEQSLPNKHKNNR